MTKIKGINPVLEALRNSANIEKLEVYKGINKNHIKNILDLASKKNIKVFYTNKREDNSQGVVALISEYDYYVELNELLENELSKEKSVIVVLDQIQDPRNFGAILRSCECFGVNALIMQDRNNAKVTETVVKSSTGAIEYVKIAQVTNISDTLEKLKKYGYFVYGAEANGNKYYYDEKYPNRVALVLGSEGNGMRKRVRETCDEVLKIHLKGKINSLNVSVAAGILLSEITKEAL